MSENLLTSGFVDPKTLPLEQLRIEICQLLQIPLKNLERLELWPHQIWIKFCQGRGLFISYRQLPLWVELGLKAIKHCITRISHKLTQSPHFILEYRSFLLLGKRADF